MKWWPAGGFRSPTAPCGFPTGRGSGSSSTTTRSRADASATGRSPIASGTTRLKCAATSIRTGSESCRAGERCYPERMRPVALTIAGSDPSGGAGIQADLKTFHQFGVYGEAVITLLTVQNTTSLDRVECLAPEFVLQQLHAVLDDIPP